MSFLSRLVDGRPTLRDPGLHLLLRGPTDLGGPPPQIPPRGHPQIRVPLLRPRVPLQRRHGYAP